MTWHWLALGGVGLAILAIAVVWMVAVRDDQPFDAGELDIGLGYEDPERDWPRRD